MAPIQVIIDNQEYRVNGRVKLIIKWLVQNAPMVAAPEKQTVAFHCAGNSVRYELTEIGNCDEEGKEI